MIITAIYTPFQKLGLALPLAKNNHLPLHEAVNDTRHTATSDYPSSDYHHQTTAVCGERLLLGLVGFVVGTAHTMD